MSGTSRRELFGSFFRGFRKQISRLEPPATGPIRPPGAIAEASFLQTCQHCRACVDVCPEQCIIPAQEHMQVATGTPFLLPDRAPCTLCGKCGEVCPSGALLPVAQEQVRIGRAQVGLETCQTGREQGCHACVLACPLPSQAIKILESGDPSILAGCTGCGLCAPACPTTAIRVVPIRR